MIVETAYPLTDGLFLFVLQIMDLLRKSIAKRAHI